LAQVAPERRERRVVAIADGALEMGLQKWTEPLELDLANPAVERETSHKRAGVDERGGRSSLALSI